jgi:AcrR family transcriptional regulator
MPTSTPPAKPQAARLTLEVIVDTAARLVADEGFDALSMRRLAKECGVGAMTLYGYVRTKEELLEALATRLLGAIELPGDELGGWEQQVARVFRSVRAVFLEHPELLPITASQRIEGIGAYRGAESLFRALRTAGLDDQQVVHAFDALVSFTIGFVQREVGLDRSDADPLPGLRKLPREEFPNVISLAGHLVTRDMDAGFDAGLELLIAGIARWTQR